MRDREVRRLANGSLETVDDTGLLLGFQVSVRRPVRPTGAALPRSLSNVLYFLPDAARAEAFYVERLGFVYTDRPPGAGPFLRPAGTDER
ncbi:glyoxalase, partial [Acinetobacter baumannii]|nr:glyoxalase [Acinetobacter baumannii]